MASFNKFERYLSRVMSTFPEVKRNAKYYYLAIQRTLNRPDANFESSYPIERISPDDRHCFFGYYDICPENEDSEMVLYHCLGTQNSTVIKLCVFNRKTNIHQTVGESEAFNFQFGSRLQWINKNKLIYNIFNKSSGSYESVCHDLIANKIQYFSFPVLALHEESIYSIDFAHLGNIGSEYGYRAHSISRHCKEPDYGVLSVSFKDNKTTEIVTMGELLKDSYWSMGSDTFHFINHFMVSPNGKFAVFLHRWTHNSGRAENLWIMDMSNLKKEILNKGMTSHYCWKNNNQLIAYLSRNGETGYFLIDIHNHSFTHINEMNQLSVGDGHPSCNKNNILVFDSYPNRSGMQNLYIFKKGDIKLAGRFFTPLFKDTNYRTDLHPRISSNGRRIYFDSYHENKRGLYCLSL